jgi:hypothetical protein
MAIWTQPVQMKTGNWRMVETSDEDANHFSSSAITRKDTRRRKRRRPARRRCTFVLDNFDKDEVIRGLFEIECEKLGMNPEGALLMMQLEFVKTARENRKD